ncbi:hypothetical protein B0I35DRAFT_409232 [Stachybotrys elegans]|uniref:Uncharacterized protein n=1 Tax=Stachybotrys elegans TaxID=80388 RepID=A0A8K0WRR7_9HYPO|nr:hypothetical protein B0I35DRAFT_409232 [Stachybotrys elegans]
MSRPETVGTLLAAIANLVSEGLRILSFADKRQWGPDEHEQARALQEVLDEAKKDFQELSPLVNGQFHYEHDRKYDSIEELKALCSKFQLHVNTLKDWARTGGPINPVWVRETKSLQKQLHRAQCRAARRIHASEQEGTSRCLGAWLVHRVQRSWSNTTSEITDEELRRRHLQEIMACKRVGVFERFGECDIAFICNYCDGHLMWEDLDSMPAARSAPPGTVEEVSPQPQRSNTLFWQASSIARTNGQEKQIVYAPFAIANHIAPIHRDWQARIICPICEEEGCRPQDEDDDEDPYRPDGEFDDVAALQEHLEWEHPPTTVPPTAGTTAVAKDASGTNSCSVM